MPIKSLTGLVGLLFALTANAQVDSLCDFVHFNGFEIPTVPDLGTPVADAGMDRQVLPGEEVVLDGSASTGETQLAYCWNLIERPADSQTTLSDRRAIAPTLIPDVAGTYRARLSVHDGQKQSQYDFVQVFSGSATATVAAADGGPAVSADGRLALSIPPNALSQETAIQTRLLSPEDIAASLGDVDAEMAYELSPDGTSFSQPVAVDFQFEKQDDAPLIAVLESGGQLEILDAVSQSDTAINLSTELEHFSRLFFLRIAFVGASADSIMADVGQPFTAEYRVNVTGGPSTLDITTRKQGSYASSPVVLPPFDTASPSVVGNLAYGTDISLSVPGATMATGTITGTCDNAGTSMLSVELEVSGGAIAFIFNNPNLSRASTIRLTFPVQCGGAQQIPTARDDLIRIPFGASSVRLPVLGNDSDPDGTIDRSTLSVVDQPRSGTVTLNGDGTFQYQATSLFRFLFSNDQFTYTVKDNDGLISNVAQVQLSRTFAVNQPPVAVEDRVTTAADQSLIINVLANDTDPDGTIDATTVEQRSNPAGSVLLQSDGSFLYQPDPGFAGVDEFRYRVADDKGLLSADATVFVTVGAPTGPNAVDDAFQASSGVATDLDVLANDLGQFDPSTLTVQNFSAFGTAQVVQDNGQFLVEYTGNPGEAGIDTLGYTVANSGGTFDQATITITLTDPNNSPPVALDDAVQTPTETLVSVDVYANDFDPDGLLTITTPELVTPPANGVATARFGAIDYTPNPGFVGQDQFTYRIQDNSFALSNTAAVLVDVVIQNDPPVANDDFVTIGVDQMLTFSVTGNDTDVDGNLDPLSVTIVSAPTSGQASVGTDGQVTYSPNMGFSGADSLTYQVSDDLGEVSNTATVNFTVATFAGSDLVPVDNASVAQLHFVTAFQDAFFNQGAGSFLGLFHAADEARMNLTQISDYTWIFKVPQPTEPAAESSYNFVTDLQSGTATYNVANEFFDFTGIGSGELFTDVSGNLTITPASGSPNFSISAPPTVLDAMDQPTIFRGAFNGLETEVQFPDGQFTHMVVRFTFQLDDMPAGVIARIPASAIPLDTNTGMRFRPILDATARDALRQRGLQPEDNAAVVFYNQQDVTGIFTGAGQRPVPLAAGRGVSLPATQLQEPIDFCAAVPTSGTECPGGPNEVLLAINRNGNITLHDSFDGTSMGVFIGDPNFTVGQGWEVIQDPNTNCLLVSDADNDAIHKYSTTGSLITSEFIGPMDAGGSGGVVMGDPRGMAFLEDDLLVALHTQGRIVRFNSQTGAFIDELITGIGSPNDIVVEPDGDIIVTDQAPSNPNDRIVLYPAADRNSPQVISSLNLSTPYQVAQLIDGNYALANFGLAAIRIFNDGFPQIGDVGLGTNSNGDTISPRGVAPLKNGNWLITADDGTGVATVDPTDPLNTLTTLEGGSTFQFIGRACFPSF